MQRMIHQSQSLEWKDGFNSVYPLPATSITSILTLWQLAVGIHNNILVILCLSASLALFKSCLICPFQLYFLTELVVISSSLDFFFFSLWPQAWCWLESLRHGPIRCWFDNYMLHTVSEKDSPTNNCSSSLANILVSLSLKESYDPFVDLYCIFQLLK